MQHGTGGSRLGLSTNDTISVENLLYGLMLVSGNDAAVALAEFIGGSVQNFANLMNTKAKEIGLISSHFVSPHGLDNEEHYTTAYELAILSNYALNNDTFCRIVNTSSYTVKINDNFKNLHNTNELLGYLNGVYGIKTGFTNGANRCLVTACKRDNLDIICVVLGCDAKKNRTLDSINLINYVFNNFSLINIKDGLNNYFDNWKKDNNPNFEINKGINSKIELYIDDSKIPYDFVAINNNCINNINYNITLKISFDAPLLPNTKIGTVDVIVNNKVYFSLDILNKKCILKKNAWFYLNYYFKNYFDILVAQ